MSSQTGKRSLQARRTRARRGRRAMLGTVQIVVAGGSGFLGGALAGSLRTNGHSVTVLTRRVRHAGDVAWGSHSDQHVWSRRVREADAVVNLAGESIAG